MLGDDMMRRILTLALLSVCFAGCSRPDNTAVQGAADAGEPVQGDWVIVRYETEPDNLNPLTSTSTYTNYINLGVNNSQIYELMMGYNTRDWAVTEPILVEAPPEISDDHLTYTFKIRDGINWHDGKPFTPDDVLFTFKAAMTPLVDSAAVRAWLTDLKDIQVEGRTMRFSMSKPNAYNIVALANTLAIIPKHVFDSEGLLDGFTFKDILGPKGKTDPKIKKFADQFNSHPNNRAPIGTGPYKFEKWDSGREIVLARNDNYWRQKGYLDKIVVRIIRDYPAALIALKSGEVDLNPRLLPIQYSQQTGGNFEEQFGKTKYSIPTYAWIGWNEEKPFFKDKRVRQAMTLLLNRQQIIDKIRFGLGRVGVTPMNPNSKNFNPNIKPWPYDPKRAAELLDEAGWKDHDGDGIRDKDGVKFSFEFLGPIGSTVFPQLSPILREECRKVGIEVTERIIDFSVMQQNLRDHRFDATTLQWTTDLYQDPYQTLHSTSALNRGSNYISFKNAESDRLIEQARLEFNDDKRRELYWKWQELIHEEQPYTFLYYPEESAAYSKRFQNVAFVPVRPGYDLTTWWVPKSQQKYKTAAP
jgi:peptide/nickel transport system substrate-binding protein